MMLDGLCFQVTAISWFSAGRYVKNRKYTGGNWDGYTLFTRI